MLDDFITYFHVIHFYFKLLSNTYLNTFTSFILHVYLNNLRKNKFSTFKTLENITTLVTPVAMLEMWEQTVLTAAVSFLVPNHFCTLTDFSPALDSSICNTTLFNLFALLFLWSIY